MREKWTDERLDDLNGKVGEGLNRVDADLRALRIETKTELVAFRGEMNDRFDRIDARSDRIDARSDRIDARSDRVDDRFDRVDDHFDRIDARLDSLQRTMVHAAIGLAGAFIAGFAALVGLVATQL